MKNSLLQSTGLLIMSISLILSCVSCSLRAYACEVIENDSIDIVTEKDTAQNHVIQIGQSTYAAQYISSKKSSLTNDVFDVYGIAEESSDLIRKYIQINSKTGKIVGFTNISPYPNIGSIESMSDSKLKKAVELMMGDLVDFTQYNHFEVKRPQNSNSVYHLVWQVKQELLCNIKADVYITSDGLITEFSRTDACPTDLTKSFVSISERNNLLEKTIIEHLDVDSINDVDYKIQSEVLTYYNNAPAIIYLVKISENGFVHLISLVIH